MSFNSYKKPRLVEPKLSKYYIDKNKEKELNIRIAQEEFEKQKNQMELLNQPIEPLHKKITNYIYNFIIENYGFVLIVSLLIILLYVRYIEVNKRKKQLKEAIEKINKENTSYD
jgi:hypothetical protein